MGVTHAYPLHQSTVSWFPGDPSGNQPVAPTVVVPPLPSDQSAPTTVQVPVP